MNRGKENAGISTEISQRQAAVHLILVGFIMGVLQYGITRLLMLKLPFNILIPFLIAFSIAAMTYGAYRYHRSSGRVSSRVLTGCFLLFLAYVLSEAYNLNTSTMFIMNLLSPQNLDLPILEPKHPGLHLASVFLSLVTFPVLFFFLGIFFARAFEQTRRPYTGYGMHLLAFLIGGIVSYGIVAVSGALQAALIAGVLSLVFLPGGAGKKVGFILLFAGVYVLSFFAPDGYQIYSIRNYKKLGTHWSPYNKVDFLEYEKGCMVTTYNNIFAYFSCSDAGKDFLHRQRFFDILAPGRERVLIIGASGGNSAQTISKANPDMKRMVTIEYVPIAVQKALGEFRRYNGNIYEDPRILPYAAEGRAFMEKDDQQYDLVFYDGGDNPFVTISSTMVSVESHVYTKEGYDLLFDKILAPDGIFILDLGGSVTEEILPFIAGIPQDVHYEIYWHAITDFPCVGPPLFWIVASRDEETMQRAAARLNNVRLWKHVPRPDIPDDFPGPTDDRPIIAGSPETLFVLSALFAVGFLLFGGLLYGRLRREEGNAMPLKPLLCVIFTLLGVAFVLAETLLVLKHARWFFSPAMGAIILISLFLGGNAAANLLYVSLPRRFRDAYGFVAVCLLTAGLYLAFRSSSTLAGTVATFLVGFAGGFFWPRAVSLIPSQGRSVALAFDGIGSMVGFAVFHAFFPVWGLRSVVPMVVGMYLLIACLFLFRRPFLALGRGIGRSGPGAISEASRGNGEPFTPDPKTGPRS